MLKKHIFIILLLLNDLFTGFLRSQNSDSLQNCKIKKGIIYTSSSVVTLGSGYFLYTTWYADYRTQSFSFFNDSGEWLQMDKIGHLTTAYYLSQLSYSGLRWSCHSKKSALKGSLAGLGYLTMVEVMDGFSNEWGFSISDMAANVGGYALFALQQQFLNRQLIQLKYSFSRSPYAPLRPNILGQSLAEQALKDYNGQTYWLCFSPFKKMNFLQVALGYGADGLLGGFDNIWKSGNELFDYSDTERLRSMYLSLDIDWIKLFHKNDTYFGPLRFVSFLKTPFPAVEFRQGGLIRFHPLFY